MAETILVIGDHDAQTKLLKNISDVYTIKPFTWSPIPGKSIQGTINLEIGIIKGDQTLQIIAVPTDAEYALDHLMEQSIGCIGVVNGRALTNQVANAISTLDELSIQYSKPCILVTMDRDPNTSQNIHALLGISESVPVVHCKSDESATNFQAINTLNQLISQEASRTAQIQTILTDLLERHGEVIDHAIIIDQHGTTYGRDSADANYEQMGFRFAAFTNMCQQMLYVCDFADLKEAVVVGEHKSLISYAVDSYNLILQVSSQLSVINYAKEVANSTVNLLRQTLNEGLLTSLA